MGFLPIVERELRAAARQPAIWWLRVLAVLAALAILGFVYLEAGRFYSASRLGQMAFTGMSVVGMLYALLTGPLTTADTLSRERRQGTLGLLFLTDLRSFDVVLGKLVAASLAMVCVLLAALPALALPVLAGGVSLPQLACVALALVNVTALSLSVGICISAMVTSLRLALALTLMVLFLLTIGLPFLGETVLRVRVNSPAAPFLYMACPLYTLQLCMNNPLRAAAWKFWVNMGGMHGLTWICLGIATWRTAGSWREVGSSGWMERWNRQLGRWAGRWRRRAAVWRPGSHRRILDLNPITWLEGRDRLTPAALILVISASAAFSFFMHLRWPRAWPDFGWVVGWALVGHYVLCLWLAIQTPHRLAEDKHSGALELLLCTPLSPRDLVLGAMRSLRRRFGRALVALLALDCYLTYAHYSMHGGWARLWRDEALVMGLLAMIVFPVQAYAFARVGLYQGLVSGGSLRASFALIWRLGVLPWCLFIGSMLVLEMARRYWRLIPRVTDNMAFSAWAVAHLIPCGLFLAHATWRLSRSFRSLAAEPYRPWWRRLAGVWAREHR